VRKLQQSSLAHDFSIQETPRALHQPYLTAKGEPAHEFFVEPTGVFNTAELLINQVGLTPGIKGPDGPGLHLQLNQFVEDIQKRSNGDFDVTVTNTVSGETRKFVAKTVVLSGGSIESPKLLQRSRVYENLPPQIKSMVGVGLTDHPTTHELTTFANHIGNVKIPKNAHAKIIFYSKGRRDAEDQIKYPFNVEMNINHEYWHLRETDPSETNPIQHEGSSRIDIKFSFANPLHDKNGVINAGEYVPEIKFRNLSWAKYLASDRFPKLAGWNKNDAGVWDVLNEITHKIFSQFGIDGNAARPVDEIWYGQRGKGFGLGTVHHATSTLRMPFREAYKESFKENSVVDENLQVVGENGLYVCDMSVMPLSSAANPVRTLVALALRLSEHISARR
jgi:choline dehydrogenase-like flavoprotein